MAQRRSLTPPPYHSSPLLSLHSTCLQPQPSPEPRSLSPKINSTIFKNPKFNNFVLQSGVQTRHPYDSPPAVPACLPSLRVSSSPGTGRTARELGPAKTFFPCILHPLLPLSAVTLTSRQLLQLQAPSCLRFTIYRQEGHSCWKSRAQTPEAMPSLLPLLASWEPAAKLLEARLPLTHAVPGRNPTQGLPSLWAAPLHRQLLAQAHLGCPAGPPGTVSPFSSAAHTPWQPQLQFHHNSLTASVPVPAGSRPQRCRGEEGEGSSELLLLFPTSMCAGSTSGETVLHSSSLFSGC